MNNCFWASNLIKKLITRSFKNMILSDISAVLSQPSTGYSEKNR